MKLMKHVWVIQFCEESGMRIAASAEKAYEICEDYIRNVAGFEGELEREWIRELEEDYKKNPEWFACEGICGAKRIEAE